ncbi:hypothetical protein ACFX2I_044719 [Malus domestica]
MDRIIKNTMTGTVEVEMKGQREGRSIKRVSPGGKGTKREFNETKRGRILRPPRRSKELENSRRYLSFGQRRLPD